jgi:hypothetical protein
MQTKQMFYAAVGAPVLAAKTVSERVIDLRTKISTEASSIGKNAELRLTAWAKEGEKVVSRITDAKVVDELAARVDFDQVQVQVSKLRDQLEDMLGTWRASFRPETTKVDKVHKPVEAKTAATKPAGKNGSTTNAAKNGPAKKGPAKAAATKAPAAKKAPAARKAATAAS